MFVNSTIALETFFGVLFNVTMLFIDITCFNSVTRYIYIYIFICQKNTLQIQQHLIVVDQEMVIINDR